MTKATTEYCRVLTSFGQNKLFACGMYEFLAESKEGGVRSQICQKA